MIVIVLITKRFMTTPPPGQQRSVLPGGPFVSLQDILEKILSEIGHDNRFRRIDLYVIEILETHKVTVVEFGDYPGKEKSQRLHN